MSWKDLLHYSRSERLAIGMLLGGILLTAAYCLFLPSQEAEWAAANADFEREYATFIASIKQQAPARKPENSYPLGPRKLSPTHFDPNTTDSASFVRMGLPAWMARNILRYRTQGGVFRRADDFAKIYGLTPEQFATLRPYIHIPDSTTRQPYSHLSKVKKNSDSLLQHIHLSDSTSRVAPRIAKYRPGTVVDLNSADTTEFKKIPGIGSHIARRLVAYRQQLGGYCSVEQLAELRLPVEQFRPWLTVTPGHTHPLDVNRTSIERLNAHPYIDFYQAKVIVEYRQKKGKLHSLQQLKLYDEFTPKDLERLQPYVCF